VTDSPPTTLSEGEPDDLIAGRSAVHEESSTGSARPARRLVFGIVVVALFMGSVDATIVATALPAIHRGLHATINWAGWTITIYGLGMIVTLPIAGKLSDQFGRRRIFLLGIALFTVSSLACGFSTEIYMLIAFRGLQAIGGAALQPSAAGLVSDHFGKDRDRAIGMFGMFFAGGQVVGPVLGGLFVGYLSWRWIFYVNVPIGIVLLAMIVKFIPESRPHTMSEKTDLRGLSLLAMCSFAVIFGITNLGDAHTAVDDPNVLAPGLCAIVLLVLFIRHSQRAIAPFIPMRLLSGRGFAVVNVESFLFNFVGFGVMSLVPLYAEQRYHLAALGAGSLLTARAIGMMAIGALATIALRRTGYRLPLVVGFVLVAIGLLLMAIAPRWGMSPYAWLSVSAGIAGLGVGAVSPAVRNASLQLAPDEVAALTGLRSMFGYMGTILSVSIVTAILNRSATPGITQAHIFWVADAIILLVMIPLVFRVPEHKGTW
jgi:EmrB/QacA subfamily drug resistance transporter